MGRSTGPVDTEALRRVADFQDFAEHADLILAAAIALDDFELAASRSEAIYWPSSDDEIHALLLEVEQLRAGAAVKHALSNNGCAFDAVGCSCGWSAKATTNEAKRAAHSAHLCQFRAGDGS